MARDETRDSLDEFYKTLYQRTRSTGRAGGNRPWVQPVLSDALAVHPKQVQEATESAKKKGVPTEFLADGRPKFTSARHMKAYCKAYHFVHRGY